MCKDEFLKKINELTYETSYRSNDDYKYSTGFDKCKEKILKIALELDIDGMTPATFNNFHESFDEIARLQRENLRMQKELHEAKIEILRLNTHIKGGKEDWKS